MGRVAGDFCFISVGETDSALWRSGEKLKENWFQWNFLLLLMGNGSGAEFTPCPQTLPGATRSARSSSAGGEGGFLWRSLLLQKGPVSAKSGVSSETGKCHERELSAGWGGKLGAGGLNVPAAARSRVPSCSRQQWHPRWDICPGKLVLNYRKKTHQTPKGEMLARARHADLSVSF